VSATHFLNLRGGWTTSNPIGANEQATVSKLSGLALVMGFLVFAVEESCAGLFCGSPAVSARQLLPSIRKTKGIMRGFSFDTWWTTFAARFYTGSPNYSCPVSCTHRRPMLVQLVCV
jgi:hypothetical protein